MPEQKSPHHSGSGREEAQCRWASESYHWATGLPSPGWLRSHSRDLMFFEDKSGPLFKLVHLRLVYLWAFSMWPRPSMARIDLVLVLVSTSHVGWGSNQPQHQSNKHRWEGKRDWSIRSRGSDEYLSQNGKPTRRGCHLMSVRETCGALGPVKSEFESASTVHSTSHSAAQSQQCVF